jgi:hypothetical protein
MPVRRKNSLPPPSAVSIRVLQGKRFQQCNVASAFLQILSELHTDILDVQSEPGLDRDGRWKQKVIAWEKFGSRLFSFSPTLTISGTIQGVKGPIPTEVADEGKRYFPILVEKG